MPYMTPASAEGKSGSASSETLPHWKMPSLSDVAIRLRRRHDRDGAAAWACSSRATMVNLPPIAEHGGLAKEECYAMTTAMMKASAAGQERPPARSWRSSFTSSSASNRTTSSAARHCHRGVVRKALCRSASRRGGAQALAPVRKCRPTERLLRLVATLTFAGLPIGALGELHEGRVLG